jgi:hypothetical protein
VVRYDTVTGFVEGDRERWVYKGSHCYEEMVLFLSDLLDGTSRVHMGPVSPFCSSSSFFSFRLYYT